MTVQKLWEDEYATAGLNCCTQIKNRITDACKHNGVQPKDLPVSLVPTDYLYHIVVMYELLYKKLWDESVLQHGEPSNFRNKNIH